MFETLGEAIAHVRRVKKIKQKDLARLAGCSVVYLSLIENNRKEPSLQLLYRIARECNVKLSELFQHCNQ